MRKNNTYRNAGTSKATGGAVDEKSKYKIKSTTLSLEVKKEENTFLKLEYFKWILIFLLSSVVCGIFLKLINTYYTPDLSRAIQYAKEISVMTGGFLPEPKERILFISAVLIFTICFFVFYFFTNNFSKKIKENNINLLFILSLVVSVSAIIYITFKGLVAENPFAANVQNQHDAFSKTNKDFYFGTTFIYNNFTLFLYILYPLILLSFFRSFNLSEKTIEIIDKLKSAFVYTFCGIIILVVFFIASFEFPYTWENKYDFNSIYYSVVQVFNGLPMLVDNFTNTYGLYPHFIVPFLKLFGLSILSFSSIMAFLLSLCFLLILLFFKKIISNKILILFGFTTIFFNSYIYSKIVTNYDAYFAIHPIRWLFPIALMFFSVLYLKARSKKLYFFSFFLFSLGILWNPDFGIITFISLVAFYSYLEFDKQKAIVIIKKISLHLFFAVTILLATFLLYSISIRIFYGNFPDLIKMFSTLRIFAFIGFNMLPMPSTYHPWMLVAITYLFGLLYAITHLINNKITSRSAIVFLLTVIGIGSFSYYQGRSHNWNLFSTNPMVFVLLTIFADDLLKIIKTQKIFFIPFSLIIFFLSFSFFQTIYDYKRITNLTTEKENKIKNRGEQKYILENAKFIDGLAAEKEKVLIFTKIRNQGLYHGFSNTSSAINPGFIDLFMKEDYNRILDFLIKNDKTKVFLEADMFRFSNNMIPSILSSLYDIKKTRPNSALMFLEKKKANTNSSFLLNKTDKSIIHEVFDTDFENKLNYACGLKGKINLEKQFSIEIIFRPVDVPLNPLTNSSTLLTNVDEKSHGMILRQYDANKTRYVFAISNTGILCPVVLNDWNYLVLQIDDSYISGYANGQFIAKVKLGNTYENSDAPLYVGNFKNNSCFFFGDIKELKISKESLNGKQISQNWNYIKTSLLK